MNQELVQQSNHKEAWRVSKKYSQILMNNITKTQIFNLIHEIYKQYINELKHKQIHYKNKTYHQVWETMLQTNLRNPKYETCISSIRILHQTNVQRSY
jgi:hypothetical protein